MKYKVTNITKNKFVCIDSDHVVYRFESAYSSYFSSYLVYPTFGSPKDFVTRGVYFTKRVEHYAI